MFLLVFAGDLPLSSAGFLTFDLAFAFCEIIIKANIITLL
jgi:hypothetical protein